MAEILHWFFVSGIILTISTLLWRKAALTQRIAWLLLSTVICSLMFFISGFFSANAQKLMIYVAIIMMPMFCWLYVAFWEKVRNNEDIIKWVSVIWLVASWAIPGFFAYLLAMIK